MTLLELILNIFIKVNRYTKLKFLFSILVLLCIIKLLTYTHMYMDVVLLFM